MLLILHHFVSKWTIDNIIWYFCIFRTLYGHFIALSAPCTAKKWPLTGLLCLCYHMWRYRVIGDWNWGDIRVLTHYIKLDFQGFRICHIMPQFQFLYKTQYLYVTYQMGKNLTSPKLPHNFFLGKNRIRKIREKSGN